jgi:hypothetical protein
MGALTGRMTHYYQRTEALGKEQEVSTTKKTQSQLALPAKRSGFFEFEPTSTKEALRKEGMKR